MQQLQAMMNDDFLGRGMQFISAPLSKGLKRQTREPEGGGFADPKLKSKQLIKIIKIQYKNKSIPLSTSIHSGPIKQGTPPDSCTNIVASFDAT